jgi:hypothetical protein
LKKLKSLFKTKQPRSPEPQAFRLWMNPSPRRAKKRKPDRFTLISWVLTLVLVAGLLGGNLVLQKHTPACDRHRPCRGDRGASAGGAFRLAYQGTSAEGSGFSSIFRALQLKTRIPERPRYETVIYRVSRGDAMYAHRRKLWGKD